MMQPFHKHLAIGALALGLIVGAGSSPAADLMWTNGSDYWQSTTAWVTNGTGGTGGFPGVNDGAYFTNAATYNVTLTDDVTVLSNVFNNASNTTATVTLNLGNYGFTSLVAFVVGDGSASTTIVYLASSTVPGSGLLAGNEIAIGVNGIGTLFVTNGTVNVAGSTVLAYGDGSRGTLVLSGPNTIWTNGNKMWIGDNANSFGSSLVISNSASMWVGSTFCLGFGSGGASSNNTFLMDSGGRLSAYSGPIHIGGNGSCSNTATVQGGAGWDNGDHTFQIGDGTAGCTGNVLTVGAGGSVTNVSHLTIFAGNTLNILGGLYGGKFSLVDDTVGTITCSGTVQGFGTIIARTWFNPGGLFSPANSLGQLVFSNDLGLVSGAMTTIQLGTNFNTTVVSSNLTLDGILNITNSGGLTNGTYTLFTYGGSLTTNGSPTILEFGTIPDLDFGYTVDISTTGLVKLIVGAPTSAVASFTGSPTNGVAPLTVAFTETSTGTITNRHWSFGDGSVADTTLPVMDHTYAAGTYTVSLTVFGLVGTNTLTRTNYIVVTNPPPPVASFIAYGTSGAAPLGLWFYDNSTGNITNWFWSFGDGGTTNTTTRDYYRFYTYNTAGTYTVSLTVSGYGGSNTLTRTNYVVVTNPPPPVASFTGSPTNGTAPLAVTFTDSSTGDITNWFWNFGDGATSNTTATTMTHTYAAGTYNVSLTVSGLGGANTLTLLNYITALTPGSISVNPASYNFGTLATGTTAQTTFVVTNSGGTTVSGGAASISSPYSVVSGTPFSVPAFGSTNVVVQFAPVAAGGFTNSVIFTSTNGGNSTNATIGAGAIVPAASFSGTPTNGAVPLTVTFTDTSTGTITNRNWSFGDGATSNTTLTSVQHIYNVAGTNTVRLIASGPLGVSTNSEANYIIATNPPAQLVVGPTSWLYGSITIGQTNTQSFSVINIGGQTLTGTATVAGPFTIAGGSPYTVAVGQTGTVNVSFIPVSAGSFVTNVIFASNGGVSTNIVSGNGLTAGSISVTPAGYSFGALTTGTTAQTTLVVTNYGGTTVSNGTASVSGPYTILSGGSFGVPGFGTTNVVVQFAPVAAGAFTNSVILTSANGGGATSTVNGTGAIVPVALFSASPTNGAVPLAVTFTDNSTGTTTNRFWSFGDGTTSNTMATSLSHTYNSAGTDTVSLIVNGPVGVSTNTQANYIVAVNPPNLVVNPASLTYGSVTVGLTNSLNFSVINTGDLPLNGTAVTALPFLILSGSPYTVAGGQTQTVSVAFAPVAAGNFTTNVVFTSNGGALTNTVTGTGLTAGNIGVSPASYSFGTLATGTLAQTTLVVTNSGGTAVSNGTASVSGPFTIISGATFSVPGFGTTNVVVQFAPVAAGASTNSVIFTSANGGAATNTVSGTGAIVPVALFTGSPTNGVAPLAVTFNDSSTGTITNRFWNLGDGTTTNTVATSLSYTYSSAGTDTVSLIVSGPVGVSTNTQANYIVVITPAQLGVNPGSLTYGSVTVGQTNSLSFSVINSGQQTLTGTVATASPFLIASGSPYTVAGGQTQTVSVAFAPTASGTFTGSVTFAGNGGVSTNTVIGTGLTAGSISVTPASYSFGALTTGTTAQTTLVITNTGGTAVSNGTASVSGPFSILSGASFSVAGFGTTNVVVQFAPVAAGAFTNNVMFASANGGTATNTVNGTGLTAGSISVTPASYNFGALTTGTTAQTTLVITNTGGTAVSNGTASVSGPFSILSGASFNVPGFGTTNVVVQFAPVAAGAFTNNVMFASANGGEATNTANGTGAIVPVALFSASPTNGAAPLAVAFTDNSTGTITNRFWSFGDNATTNTTAPGLSHTYSSAGTDTVTLIVSGPVGVSTNTQAGYIVALNPANLVVNPGSLSYGSVTVGLTNSLSFSVINSGQQTLTGSVATASPFLVVSGSPYTVPGGQTQAVSVALAPVAAGNFSTNVIFTSNGGVSTNLVSGTGLTVGNIGVNPASYSFGTLATGNLAQTTLVVTNSGGTAVSNGTASVSAPFSILSGANFSVAGFGTTNVVVQFAPVAAGAFTNTVIFASANGGGATSTVNGAGATVPVALFSASLTNGAAPLAVTFTDNSTGTITNRFWSFGDSTTTNTTTPGLSHTYSSAGTDTVTLIVSGPVGVSTNTKAGYIVVAVPDTTPPQLIISSPTNYQSFTNAAITVSGTASDASGIQSVTVNGTATLPAGTNWTEPFTLSMGTNTITVIATDASANMNTATQVVHAVLNMTAATSHPPQITAGLWVTNALLQAGSTAVVLVDETNVFAVSATDEDGDSLQYQWTFGDGDSANTTTGTVEHVYTNECGPYGANVTVSDGQASTNSDLVVAVACQMQITKLQIRLDFAKTNSDSCTVQGMFELPASYSFSNKLATLDVGGAEVFFTLPSKAGTAHSGQSTFAKPTYKKQTGQWEFSATLKDGFWQGDWADYGMIDSNIPNPGVLVTNFPVIFVIDTEAFVEMTNLHYTAKSGRTGAAK
jgi:PKD repeat protein